ncbi:MAG: glutaminase A [Phycisphaerales bacterium]|nr:glutaminase A [Phycisphaerae bacterium]NNF43533.1 glutaminase A [Phycisphaerales bacterium]NNM25030.1 glutaminase A [Phycisphaerales bacterium]
MSRERLLFESLLQPGEDTVAKSGFRRVLDAMGIRADDPRLAESQRVLSAIDGDRIAPDEFVDVIGPNALLLDRALKKQLVIPDFEEFSRDVRRIFEATRGNAAGVVADYIPQLGRVDPDQFGVSICTIDGQRVAVGDTDRPFCVHSACKPVSYCLALEEHGEEVVHRHIGCEPSGQSFNELTLNREGRPHNPMINAGAIMSGALIRSRKPMADRFDHVMDAWRRACGGERPGFSNTMYLSERQTGDRNFALAYYMRENGVFPEGVDLVETLEFYFQCCSIEVTTEAMAVVAATLANGGVCPLTGERIFGAGTVQKCLSLMDSCGLYDFSGEWAFRIGLPAKSSVSGVIMTVVPNVLGVCTWSPRLDEHGNSVRGIDFGRELVRTFNFHNYDSIVGGLHGKKDPRVLREDVQRSLVVDLCWAASEGDLAGIQRLVLQDAQLDGADYDGRTALHLAAAEGRDEIVAYLLEQGVDPAPVDRWGGTPLDDARRRQHTRIAALLQAAGTRTASDAA